MNSIVHFEIPVDDEETAKKFYSEVFGWQVRTDEMPGGGSYTSAITTPVDDDQMPIKPGAINGALIPRDEKLRHPVVTVEVDSIDDAIAKVVKAGGSELMGKATIPGMGEYAYVRDPAGNVIGLWHTISE